MTDAPKVDRLALRVDEVAESLGLSRRHVERMRSAGRFPVPDRMAGRAPLWRPETIQKWMGESTSK
jgi:excisionase family DNA binding protein